MQHHVSIPALHIPNNLTLALAAKRDTQSPYQLTQPRLRHSVSFIQKRHKGSCQTSRSRVPGIRLRAEHPIPPSMERFEMRADDDVTGP